MPAIVITYPSRDFAHLPFPRRQQRPNQQGTISFQAVKGFFYLLGRAPGVDLGTLQVTVKPLRQVKVPPPDPTIDPPILRPTASQQKVPPILVRSKTDWAFRIKNIDPAWYKHPMQVTVSSTTKGVDPADLIILWTRKDNDALDLAGPQGSYGAGFVYPTGGETDVSRNLLAIADITPSGSMAMATLTNPSATDTLYGSGCAPALSDDPPRWTFQFDVPNDWGDNSQVTTLTVVVYEPGGYQEASIVTFKFAA